MSNIGLSNRIKAIASLAQFITKDQEKLISAIEYAKLKNPWFTEENCWMALDGIKSNFLNEEILQKWSSSYSIENSIKNVGLILAGNLPLVGFHDVLSCFIAGHKSLIKLSDKDNVLSKYLLDTLITNFPEYADHFIFVDRLKGFDAVIATGSNNSARYFEYYFGQKPNIIRKNRNGIAVLDGSESDDELRKLSIDVFAYFGLGCRNVSKIYVPKDYNLNHLMEILHEKKEIILHSKYKNNYDYNISLFMLNRIEYLNNGSIILKEDVAKASRISCLHYEYYNQLAELESELKNELDEIQCIASKLNFSSVETVDLGETQFPKIDDYADGVDTMKFLNSI